MTGDKEELKLRKAKANGVRLAAGVIEQEHGHDLGLRALADKIERGEA